MLPRPIIATLGVTYRRIPIMVLGNDVYADTSLMIQVLEERFTDGDVHPALLNPHSSLQEASVVYWVDRVFFPATSALLPGKSLTKEFIADRNALQASFHPLPRHAHSPIGRSSPQVVQSGEPGLYHLA